MSGMLWIVVSRLRFVDLTSAMGNIYDGFNAGIE